MYEYMWDKETGGLLLTTNPLKFSKEPRPVYYRELDILGLDKYWDYPKDDSAPIMWAELNYYVYRGRNVAKTVGGSIYTKPKIEILDEPEPDGTPLQVVDVAAMCEKNRDVLETLAQETIQKIYITYMEYRDKVDVFYVAFSGGKDSVVTLDLVQRALPHDSFLVLFGDTQMEFSDTYDVVKKQRKLCESEKIKFVVAKSNLEPKYTWNVIGPPAQKMRWCCSVHKTAPQILCLRTLTGNAQFRGMAMMGVRADESVTRSRYEQLNFGTKHQGQYDYYPILFWNSAELFLYIFQQNLLMNETYKKGNSRAGCLVCPMEASKNSWFKSQSYSGSKRNKHTTSFYLDIITKLTFACELPPDKYKEFMEIGVWKSRHNGAKLVNPQNIFHEEKRGSDYYIILDKLSVDWKQWLKTVGEVTYTSDENISIYCNKKTYTLSYSEGEQHTFIIRNIGNTADDIFFLSWMKTVLRKSAYCICCQVCEANCPNGYIHMSGKNFFIDDKCVKCKKCYKIDNGCVVADSQLMPKEGNKMNGSIDQYKNMGINYLWVEEYFKDPQGFWANNNLGSQMISSLKAFLRHSGVFEDKKLTNFGEKMCKLSANSQVAWALMLCNLAYTPQFNWWIKNIDFDYTYSNAELNDMLSGLVTDNSRKNIVSGFKNILYSNTILSNLIGFGTINIEKKGKNTILVDVKRTPWQSPVPEVILYSLYKFAESCENYYQFSLSTLMDDTIERDGISPTRIFGLDRDTMVALLNGLGTHYPEFIRASFTLDLETITLSEDKTSNDVLDLF